MRYAFKSYLWFQYTNLTRIKKKKKKNLTDAPKSDSTKKLSEFVRSFFLIYKFRIVSAAEQEKKLKSQLSIPNWQF